MFSLTVKTFCTSFVCHNVVTFNKRFPLFPAGIVLQDILSYCPLLFMFLILFQYNLCICFSPSICTSLSLSSSTFLGSPFRFHLLKLHFSLLLFCFVYEFLSLPLHILHHSPSGPSLTLHQYTLSSNLFFYLFPFSLVFHFFPHSYITIFTLFVTLLYVSSVLFPVSLFQNISFYVKLLSRHHFPLFLSLHFFFFCLFISYLSL